VIWPVSRGQVVRADVGVDEPQVFVVVSNNGRNRRLGSVLAAKLMTSTKPSIPRRLRPTTGRLRT
jgi:mRNA interferase MazF